MGLFKKRPDPISDRSRELTAKISDLEARIKKLNEEVHSDQQGPRLRSTAYPGATPDTTPPAAAPKTHEPVFEKVDQAHLKTPMERAEPPEHFPELGARKFGLKSLWERLKRELQGPPAANPKLVSYLAAGSIQGLRPLRYEKRVWRNRCIALAILLLLAFLGIFYALEHRH